MKLIKNDSVIYYARAIDPTTLVVLNSLAAVHTQPIIETAKTITQLLNYSTSHPDAVTEYRRSGMILHIYSDASYISEPDARSRAGGVFISPKSSNKPLITEIPQ